MQNSVARALQSRSGHRVNAPAGQFGVLYAAEAIEAAFSETFIRLGQRPPVVQESMLARRTVSELKWHRALRVVDFTGAALVRLGVDARLTSMDDYPLCQRWALWLHQHPALPDGILYRARTAPHCRSLALFERAGAPAPSTALTPSLASIAFTARLGEILEMFGAELT